MDKMIDKISQNLARQNIKFNPEDQHVRCLAHVINLAAKTLIDSLATPCEDENSFEHAEDTEDNLNDAIYKVILFQSI